MDERMPPDLLRHLGIGYYLLGPHDEIIEVNSAWRAIFSAPSTDLSGRRLTDFYVIPDEARALHEQLIQTGEVQTVTHWMIRQTGEWFYAEITAKGLFDPSTNTFQGQEAIIRDVTQTEVRNRIVEWLPVGFYMVQVNNGRHDIAYCNTAFAEMFGFKDRADALGYDIAKLYQNPKDMGIFLDKIAESDKDNNTRQVDVKTIKGKRFIVEATVKWTKDARGAAIARYGLVRGLMYDMPLKGLRTNLANVLHTYTNNQIPLHFVLQRAIEALGPSPFNPAQRPSEDMILAHLDSPVAAMTEALKMINDHLTNLDILNETAEGLFELEDALERVYPFEISCQLHAWLDIAKKARTRAEEADDVYPLPAQALDSLLINAAEVERLALLILLITRDNDFLEIDHEVRSFSDYLNASERISQENQVETVDLVTIVKQACNDMGAFAISRDITIRGPRATNEMKVLTNRRDLLRIMSNIIHNAVKYSWEPRRRDPGGREVQVRLIEKGDGYILRVTNLGVPVPPDELQLVFESGYRGRLATDRGRLGSGIGLSDAKSVIERYGGTITIESKPASPLDPGRRPDDGPPYLTTVLVHLPKHEEENVQT